MGVDLKDLPAHVQKQIADQGKQAKEYAISSMKVKAYPHDHRMNKTEKNYAAHLEKLKITGEIFDYKHEPFNLRLADRTFYKPDFAVVTNDGHILIDEVKGIWQDDALVKIKVAAETHPWFIFRAVFEERGGYRYRNFNSLKKGYNYG